MWPDSVPFYFKKEALIAFFSMALGMAVGVLVGYSPNREVMNGEKCIQREPKLLNGLGVYKNRREENIKSLPTKKVEPNCNIDLVKGSGASDEYRGILTSLSGSDIEDKEKITLLVKAYRTLGFEGYDKIDALLRSAEFFDENFIESIFDSYVDANDHRDKEALRNILYISGSKVLAPTLAALAEEYDKNRKLAALEIMNDLHMTSDEKTQKSFFSMLELEEDSDVASALLNSIRHTPISPSETRRFVTIIENKLNHHDSKVRAAAIKRIVEWEKTDKVHAHINRSLKDVDHDVKIAAIRAVKKSNIRNNSIKSHLIDLVYDTSLPVHVSHNARSALLNSYSLTHEEFEFILQM